MLSIPCSDGNASDVHMPKLSDLLGRIRHSKDSTKEMRLLKPVGVVGAVAGICLASVIGLAGLPSVSGRDAVSDAPSFSSIMSALADSSTKDDDGLLRTASVTDTEARGAMNVAANPLSDNSKLEGRRDVIAYMNELATLKSSVSGETDGVVSGELADYVSDDDKKSLTSSENAMRSAISFASYNESRGAFDSKVSEIQGKKEEAERRAAEEAARRAAAAAAAAAARQQQQAVYSRGYSGGSSSCGSSGYNSSWNPSYVTAYGSQASIDAGRTYLTEFAPGYFAGHRHFSVGQSIASHPQYVTVNGQKYQYAGTQNFANGSSLSAATGWAGTDSGNIAFQTCNNDGATVQVNKYVPVG